MQRFLLLLVLGTPLALGGRASPQTGQTSSQSAATSTQTPDPLGRDNPRGCVFGFIKAAQQEKYSVAVQYFQPVIGRRRPTQEEDEDLAEQLLTILNEKFAGSLDFISRDPQGRLDDGLPPDQEQVGSILGKDTFPILLVRIEDEQDRELWYFSRTTLARVPRVYDTLMFPVLEKHIPDYLVEHRFLSMPYWQWLGTFAFIPFALLAARGLTKALELSIRYYRKARHLPPRPSEPLKRIGPVTFLFALLIHYFLVGYIGTSLLYRIYYRRVIGIFLVFSLYWLLMRITRVVSDKVASSFSRRAMYAERSIASLVRRVAEVAIFVFVAFLLLHGLGLNVSTALAGIGIGTLALGLGAQKTFENLFGGISILFDKVIQVGDMCNVNNQTGVVEDIGLRSTRLRTIERTLLSVPNGIMASTVLENLRFRDKFLCQQVIRLRYGLSPDHMRYVLERIRALLREHPKIEDSTAWVRFMRFSDYALEIEIYCYILEREYTEFLSAREALLLSVMDLLEEAGAVVAVPMQAPFVTQGPWVDPAKGKVADAEAH
jgi:MscS family membrane protein